MRLLENKGKHNRFQVGLVAPYPRHCLGVGGRIVAEVVELAIARLGHYTIAECICYTSYYILVSREASAFTLSNTSYNFINSSSGRLESDTSLISSRSSSELSDSATGRPFFTITRIFF